MAGSRPVQGNIPDENFRTREHQRFDVTGEEVGRRSSKRPAGEQKKKKPRPKPEADDKGEDDDGYR